MSYTCGFCDFNSETDGDWWIQECECRCHIIGRGIE